MAGTQSPSIIVILCLILAALMGSARGQDMTTAAAAPIVSPDMAPAPAPDATAPTTDAAAPAPAPDAAAAPAPDTNAADAAQAPAPQAEAAAAPAPGPGIDITSTAATAYQRNGPPPSEQTYFILPVPALGLPICHLPSEQMACIHTVQRKCTFLSNHDLHHEQHLHDPCMER